MVSIVKAGSSTGGGASTYTPASYTPDSGDQSSPDFTSATSFNTGSMDSQLQGLQDGTLVQNGNSEGGPDNYGDGNTVGDLVTTGNVQDPYAAYTGTVAGSNNFEIGNAAAGGSSQDIEVNPNTGAASITAPVANPADDSWEKFGIVAGIGALPILGGLSAAGEFGDAAAVGAGAGTGVAADTGAGLDTVYGTSAAGGLADASGAGIPAVDGLTGAGVAAGGGTALDSSLGSSLGVDGASSYLPATSATDLTTLGGDASAGLGVDGTGAVSPMDAITGANGASPALVTPPAADAASFLPDVPETSLGSSLLSGAENFLSNPKNDLSLGLGLASVLEGTSTPKLPAGAQTASTNATALNSAALGVINSGGYSAPSWASQKASIDATIAQEEQQQTEALEQNAANSGQTGMVQSQQVNALKQNLEVQRQQLYAAALQQNVQDAIAEYTGSNSTLLGVSNLQYQQSAEAKAAATQMAALAAKLYGLSGSGSTTTTTVQNS